MLRIQKKKKKNENSFRKMHFLASSFEAERNIIIQNNLKITSISFREERWDKVTFTKMLWKKNKD